MSVSFFFFFFKHLFIYLRLCWVFVSVRRLSLVVAKRGPLFIAMRGPLIIAASLVAEHRLQTRRLSNCGSWAQLLRGMWDLPRPGLEPLSPALAGRFSTTAPPGKLLSVSLKFKYIPTINPVLSLLGIMCMYLFDKYRINFKNLCGEACLPWAGLQRPQHKGLGERGAVEVWVSPPRRQGAVRGRE